jgi:hypothetical protein
MQISMHLYFINDHILFAGNLDNPIMSSGGFPPSNTTRKNQATATSWQAAFSTQASMETKVIVLTYLSGTTLWLQRGEPEQCRQKV